MVVCDQKHAQPHSNLSNLLCFYVNRYVVYLNWSETVLFLIWSSFNNRSLRLFNNIFLLQNKVYSTLFNIEKIYEYFIFVNLAKKQVSDSKDIPAIKNELRFPKLHSSDFDVDQTSVDQYESTSKSVFQFYVSLCILGNKE